MRTAKGRGLWRVVVISLLGFGAVGRGPAGQNVGATTGSGVAAVESSWPEVSLNVLVTGKSDAPQRIEEGAFELFEDGVERQLKVQGSQETPVSLALLIDSSGSIFERRDAILAAVKALVKGLPGGSEVAVMDFNSVAYLDVPFTTALKADLSVLARVNARGPTALYDAIISTESYVLANAHYARRALVILSDGRDNASHASIRNVFWKMEQPGSPVVYSCLTSKGNILQSELMAGHIDMRFLAKRGGGTEFNLDPDPESAAAGILKAIRSQYVLQFTASDPVRDGKARKLAVRLAVKDVQVHVLSGYFAAAK